MYIELLENIKGQAIFNIIHLYFKQSHIFGKIFVGISVQTDGASSIVGSIKGFIAKQININN